MTVTQIAPEMVGAVTAQRFQALVAEGRALVETATRAQFALGDQALEIEPLRPVGGRANPDPELRVYRTLAVYAEAIGLSLKTLLSHRYVSSRWPKEQRATGVSHHIHRILASVEDDSERWALLRRPPRPEWSPSGRWTSDAAKRVVGQTVDTPVTVEEKLFAINDLAKDAEVAAKFVSGDVLSRPEVAELTTAEQKIEAIRELARDTGVAAKVATDLLRRPEVVAAASATDKVSVIRDLARDTTIATTVTTDLLRRPEVAAATMRDESARHQVNRAQIDAARAGAETTRAIAAPALARVEHTAAFVELLGSCAAFVTGVGRIIPALTEQPVDDRELAVIHQNIGKVRATCDWLDTAVDTGNTGMDEALAELLRDR